MTEIYAKPIPRIATVCVGDELSYAHNERLTEELKDKYGGYNKQLSKDRARKMIKYNRERFDHIISAAVEDIIKMGFVNPTVEGSNDGNYDDFYIRAEHAVPEIADRFLVEKYERYGLKSNFKGYTARVGTSDTFVYMVDYGKLIRRCPNTDREIIWSTLRQVSRARNSIADLLGVSHEKFIDDTTVMELPNVAFEMRRKEINDHINSYNNKKHKILSIIEQKKKLTRDIEMLDKDEIETTWKLAQEQTWLEQNNIPKGENGYRVM